MSSSDDFYIELYRRFVSHLETYDKLFWAFMSGYTTAILSLKAFQIPKDVLPLAMMISSFLGINLIIERGKWFFRNSVLVVRIEHLKLIDPKNVFPEDYTNPDNFNKVFDTIATIFACILLATALTNTITCETTFNIKVFIYSFGSSLIVALIGQFVGELITRYFQNRLDIKLRKAFVGVLLISGLFCILFCYLSSLLISKIWSLEVTPAPGCYTLSLFIVLTFLTFYNYCKAKKHIVMCVEHTKERIKEKKLRKNAKHLQHF